MPSTTGEGGGDVLCCDVLCCAVIHSSPSLFSPPSGCRRVVLTPGASSPRGSCAAWSPPGRASATTRTCKTPTRCGAHTTLHYALLGRYTPPSLSSLSSLLHHTAPHHITEHHITLRHITLHYTVSITQSSQQLSVQLQNMCVFLLLMYYYCMYCIVLSCIIPIPMPTPLCLHSLQLHHADPRTYHGAPQQHQEAARD
jgi:hypothetical protein